eukprot:TRINITY_DN9467_c0_g1_i1.p1 TRINITY_DN9467_c0_g1~~TRINITY_DN9467_c0_g1_i1.p1  ORF type:complete len:541 (-),score=191.10 TRINITY_DN9467_c0_g1_i1:149-1771(-)
MSDQPQPQEQQPQEKTPEVVATTTEANTPASAPPAAAAKDAKTVQQARKEKKEARKAQQEAKKANPQANKRGGGKNSKQQPQKGDEAASGEGKQLPSTTEVEPSKTVIDVQPLPGLRDFHPDQMAIRNWLFGIWREVSKTFAFAEYDAPMLERQELYKRKAGEEIVDQMFAFVDKEDREVTLRPEMTPSLARLVLQRGRSLLLPIRWFSIPQCWRFETTTRGRKREHFQWNMDIFGVKQVSAEAELIAAIVTFFQKVGLNSDQIGIRFSSRKVVQHILEKAGVTGEKFAPACIIIDKMDKLERSEVIKQLTETVGLSEEVCNKLIDTIKVPELDKFEEIMGSDNEAVKDLKTFQTLVRGYGFGDWIRFDATVIRGLAYYTGIVFEAFDKRKEGIPRAICGGGRYDRLMSIYEAEDIPACGFGFGDCVILEILQELKLVPDLSSFVQDVVIAFDEELRVVAIQVATKLRQKGRVVDMVLERKAFRHIYSYIDRVGAKRAILIAPEEWKNGKVRVKDMTLGAEVSNDAKQVDVTIDELLAMS